MQIRNEAAVKVGCGTNQSKINVDKAKNRLFKIGLTALTSSDNKLKARTKKNN
jgi:hypothetical protein